MRSDRKLAEAIVQLTPHPAFQYLLEQIRENEAEAMLACTGTEGNVLYRAQGKYQGLHGLLEAIDGARDLLNKSK